MHDLSDDDLGPGQIAVRFRTGAGNETDAVADQLTEKGLFVHTTQVAPVDAKLELLVRLPDVRAPLRLHATVIYSNPPGRPGVRSALPPGMGVKFTGLEDRERDLIRSASTLGPGASDRDLIRVDTSVGTTRPTAPRPSSAPRASRDPEPRARPAREPAEAAPGGLRGLLTRLRGGSGGGARKSKTSSNAPSRKPSRPKPDSEG